MSAEPIRSVLRRALRLQPPADFATQMREHAMRVVRGEVEPRRRHLSFAPVAMSVVAAAAAAAVSVIAVQNHAAHHVAPTGPAASPSLPAVIAPSPPPPATPAPPAQPTGVEDMTWISDREGWALARQTCRASPCDRVLHTSDGVHWEALSTVQNGEATTCGDSAGIASCVRHIRFANYKIGYLFGDALQITTDGGLTWRAAAGQTFALEIAGGNAVRVTAPDPYVLGGGHRFSVEQAAIGTTAWHRVLDVVPGPGFAPLLQRDGSQRIYVTSIGNAAGGGYYISPIATSSDGGRTFTQIADPCTTTGTDWMLLDMSAAPPGRLAVQCLRRGDGGTVVRVSGNAGASFAPASPKTDMPLGGLIEITGGGVLVALREDISAPETRFSIEVSKDQGTTWTETAQLGTAPPKAPAYVWIGFQDARTGRATVNGTLWTTHDGGFTWTPTPI